ncbi:MAG: histidine phosphatase family protein [Rickettsiales bacterium]|jgi:broad specificity phosphatase PhoE|nr:histidine phosphatase family protein [Rickettsiales bacterium]
MSVKIVFESHSTTFDNENKIASGWYDAELSPLGIQQSFELGDRRRNQGFDAVFVADQYRAYQSAQIAFYGTDTEIIIDPRLRECNYGDMNHTSSKEVEEQKINRISEPFPNGESYMQTYERMADFLKNLAMNYDGKKVLIVGARATQWGIEHFIKGTPYETLVTTKFKWQPGWEYELENI